MRIPGREPNGHGMYGYASTSASAYACPVVMAPPTSAPTPPHLPSSYRGNTTIATATASTTRPAIARQPGSNNHSRSPQAPLPTDSSSEDDFIGAVPKLKKQRAGARPASHSRSISHPFPSLFSSKKKKQHQHLVGLDDSTDDDQPALPSPRGFPAVGSTQNMAPRKQTRGPVDFANGNCMTCGGLVRWPKELDIFRCTICTTINDLKPLDPARDEPQGGGGGGGYVGPMTLSLEHTRFLTHESLRSSLRAFMALNGRTVTPTAWPPRTVSRGAEDYFSQGLRPGAGHARTSSRNGTPPTYVHNPVFDDYADEHVELRPTDPNGSANRSYSTSFPDARSSSLPLRPRPSFSNGADPKLVFKRVEDYLVASFRSHAHVNASFTTQRQSFSSKQPVRIARKPVPDTRREKPPGGSDEANVAELDPKLLLLGNFAENGTWWTGNQQQDAPRPASRPGRKESPSSLVTSRSPRIDWGVLFEWYHLVINAAENWTSIYDEMVEKDPSRKLSETEKQRFAAVLLEAQDHLQRVLLKCTETLLKRPGRQLKEPQDVRFLLIILANPLLHPSHKAYSGTQPPTPGKERAMAGHNNDDSNGAAGRHSGIIKRILGLFSNATENCQHHTMVWFSKLPEHLILQIKDLVGSFVTYRLTRQDTHKVESKIDVTDGLIPQMSHNRSNNTPATLHAALEAASGSKKQKKPPEKPKILPYSDDWQIKAAAKVMALLFAANNMTHVRRNEVSTRHAHGHLLATSDFYNSLLDCMDFKGDFEAWESRRGKFAFCQYPFFLSIWAKIQILEFDAKRQMAGKAREAFFDSILSKRSYTQYLFLQVRRECLVDDSLKQVSEVVGSGSEDIKKGLRVEFRGEEGIDAGGLRKEWFLLLVREVFHPDHGRSPHSAAL